MGCTKYDKKYLNHISRFPVFHIIYFCSNQKLVLLLQRFLLIYNYEAKLSLYTFLILQKTWNISIGHVKRQIFIWHIFNDSLQGFEAGSINWIISPTFKKLFRQFWRTNWRWSQMTSLSTNQFLYLVVIFFMVRNISWKNTIYRFNCYLRRI